VKIILDWLMSMGPKGIEREEDEELVFQNLGSFPERRGAHRGESARAAPDAFLRATDPRTGWGLFADENGPLNLNLDPFEQDLDLFRITHKPRLLLGHARHGRYTVAASQANKPA
jgi:hypothetical protein